MLKDGDKTNFETMKQATKDGNLALMECKDAKTGEYVAVLCMVNQPQKEGDDFEFVPVARMFSGNPYEEVLPPE